MKKKMFLVVIIVFGLFVTGCGNDKINKNSEVVKVKNQMLEKLDNYSYDVVMTTKTGAGDVNIEMKCKADNKSKLTYCITSTIAVDVEQYYDYNKKVEYSRTKAIYGGNSEWKKTEIKETGSNIWLDLSDYIFDLEEEVSDNGTYYRGTISSKKLIKAMTKMNSKIKLSKIVSDDIPIEVFINSSGYIESINYTMQVMGVDEVVQIKFKDYNTTSGVELPADVK